MRTTPSRVSYCAQRHAYKYRRVCYYTHTSIPRNSLASDHNPDPADSFRPSPRKTATLSPSLWLGREGSVEAQLKALQHCHFPTVDHGVETLYRFANFDPWQRSRYFGRSLDLGQWERFKRILYSPCYYTLINHSRYQLISSLEVSEDVWKARIKVINDLRKGEECIYEFTMIERKTGKYEGAWFTESLIADGCDEKQIIGII